MVYNILLNLLLGTFLGYLLELGYRSKNAGYLIRPKLINPLMYGLTAVFIFILYLSNLSLGIKIVLIFIVPTLIEFTVGYAYLRLKKVRLWDYSGESFNFMSLVSLRFSIYWFLLALVYVLILNFIFPELAGN